MRQTRKASPIRMTDSVAARVVALVEPVLGRVRDLEVARDARTSGRGGAAHGVEPIDRRDVVRRRDGREIEPGHAGGHARRDGGVGSGHGVGFGELGDAEAGGGHVEGGGGGDVEEVLAADDEVEGGDGSGGVESLGGAASEDLRGRGGEAGGVEHGGESADLGGWGGGVGAAGVVLGAAAEGDVDELHAGRRGQRSRTRDGRRGSGQVAADGWDGSSNHADIEVEGRGESRGEQSGEEKSDRVHDAVVGLQPGELSK